MTRGLRSTSLFVKVTAVFLAVIIALCAIYLYSYVTSMRLLESGRIATLDAAGRSRVQAMDRQIARVKRAIYNVYAMQDLNALAMTVGYVLDYDVLQKIRSAEDSIRLIDNGSEIIDEVLVLFPRWGRSLSATFGLVDYDADRWETVSMPRDSVGAQIVYQDGSAYLTTRYQQANPDLFSIVAVLSFEDADPASGGYGMADVPLSSYLFDIGSGAILSSREVFGEADAYLRQQVLACDFTEEGPVAWTVGGSRYLVLSAASSYSNLRVVNVVRPVDLVEPFARQTTLVILFTILISLSVVGVLAYLRHSIVLPIGKMVQAFRPVEQGDFSVSLAPTTNDEFATLYTSFNHMVENLHVLVNEVYQKELLVQRASLKQLQSQINPHFLYNSLYALSAMIKIGDNENADRFCMYLATYFRYITRSGADLVPLADEWRHAENYLHIMSMRNSAIRVEFQDDLPEGVRDLVVPRLVVQPILENAFKHGGRNVSAFHLRVSALVEASRLAIRVEDNGRGTTDRDLEDLAAHIRDPRPQLEATGLINIHRRLRLVFGPEAGLLPSRSELGGVCMTALLPLKGGDPDDLPDHGR